MSYRTPIVENLICPEIMLEVRIMRVICGFTEEDIQSMTDIDPDDVFKKALLERPQVHEEICLDRNQEGCCVACKYFSAKNNSLAMLIGIEGVHIFDPFS